MNTNKGSFRGFGVYFLLILAVVLIWYWMSGNSATSSYTKAQFVRDLQEDNVTSVTILQNREIPTGSLKVTLKNKSQQYLYASNVNEMQSLMDENSFTTYVLADIPKESWLMTLLPYLLIFKHKQKEEA